MWEDKRPLALTFVGDESNVTGSESHTPGPPATTDTD